MAQSYHNQITLSSNEDNEAEENNNTLTNKTGSDHGTAISKSDDSKQLNSNPGDVRQDGGPHGDEKFIGRSLSRASVISRASSIRSNRFSRGSVRSKESKTSFIEPSAPPPTVVHRLPRAGRQRIYVHR